MKLERLELENSSRLLGFTAGVGKLEKSIEVWKINQQELSNCRETFKVQKKKLSNFARYLAT